MKRINLVLISFALGALFACGAIYWSMMAEDANAAATKAADAQPAAADQRALFKVDSISCGACESRIRGALSAAPGVAGVEVNLEERTVAVDYVKNLTDEKKLAAEIDNTGYPARFLSFGAPSASATTKLPRKGCGGSCCGG